ncbi:hypothetical protein B0H13DRAFT_1895918 [Mycena leptocephala]|nr:hypothetical protein B0H13DRAFT_1895918 [Mycena leptocephala]
MADPAGALWFALLQLLILSLSQEICPLRGLSTQSTSSSLSWCPLLHSGPFGFNPDPILFAFIIASGFLACLHLLSQSHGRWTIVWLAPTSRAACSSCSHTHLCLHLVALITIRRPCVVPEADILASSTQTRTLLNQCGGWFRHDVW